MRGASVNLTVVDGEGAIGKEGLDREMRMLMKTTEGIKKKTDTQIVQFKRKYDECNTRKTDLIETLNIKVG
jgi:hypothetical protein